MAGLAPAGDASRRGTVVVANRGDGTLTLIDVRTDTPRTLALPPGDADPEPMYVVYAAGRLFVGDRANDRVVVYQPRDWSVEATVPAGDGVFHMWADPRGRQLWVNNDGDDTITVIDARLLDVLATIDLPADLVARGGSPHDVILDRRSAYVTMIGVGGENGGPDEGDAVIRYSLRTFDEQARAVVGDDPHVTIDPDRGRLFVASQGASEVALLNRRSLERVDTVAVPAAHGLDIGRRGRVVYATNIAGGGTDALYTIDARSGAIIGEPVDAPVPTPHNIVLTARNDKLYVTHSGATADQVSVYSIGRDGPVPVFETTVTAGLNPFGLEFVPR